MNCHWFTRIYSSNLTEQFWSKIEIWRSKIKNIEYTINFLTSPSILKNKFPHKKRKEGQVPLFAVKDIEEFL